VKYPGVEQCFSEHYEYDAREWDAELKVEKAHVGYSVLEASAVVQLDGLEGAGREPTRAFRWWAARVTIARQWFQGASAAWQEAAQEPRTRELDEYDAVQHGRVEDDDDVAKSQDVEGLGEKEAGVAKQRGWWAARTSISRAWLGTMASEAKGEDVFVEVYDAEQYDGVEQRTSVQYEFGTEQYDWGEYDAVQHGRVEQCNGVQGEFYVEHAGEPPEPEGLFFGRTAEALAGLKTRFWELSDQLGRLRELAEEREWEQEQDLERLRSLQAAGCGPADGGGSDSEGEQLYALLRGWSDGLRSPAAWRARVQLSSLDAEFIARVDREDDAMTVCR